MNRGLLLLLVALGVASPSRAQDDPGSAPPDAARSAPSTPGPSTRYRYEPVVDIPVTLLAGAIAGGPRLFGDELPGPAPGDPDQVFVLDRFVARSPETRESAKTASDVVLYASLALGAASTIGSLGDDRGSRVERRRERFRRLGIFAETILSTNALTTIVKLGARRPRPFTYGSDYDPSSGSLDDETSFFSGHTSSVAAASTAAAYFAFAESERDARRFAIVAAGSVATLSVATLRVRAARHFPTDVATGAIVGACMGVLVPHLHRETGLAVDVAAVRGGGLLTIGGVLPL